MVVGTMGKREGTEGDPYLSALHGRRGAGGQVQVPMEVGKERGVS